MAGNSIKYAGNTHQDYNIINVVLDDPCMVVNDADSPLRMGNALDIPNNEHRLIRNNSNDNNVYDKSVRSKLIDTF
jgi:hypothetical protein